MKLKGITRGSLFRGSISLRAHVTGRPSNYYLYLDLVPAWSMFNATEVLLQYLVHNYPYVPTNIRLI